MSHYSYDEDDLDVHIRRRHSPEPVRYVSTAPRQYYPPSYLVPDQGMRVVARSRSRERNSPPQPAGPVIIQNKIYNDMSSDDEYEPSRRRRPRRRSSYSRSRSRSRSRYMTKEDWQLELDRREIERLRIEQAKEKEHRRASKERQDDEELRRAKEELDVIKRREAQAEEEKRIKREIELKRLRDEERAAAEKDIRDKEAKAAVEKYKKEEAERREREEREKKAADKEYQRRLQEQLLSSGLDEEAINAILKKQKVPEARNERATYTRMPRKHLSIETLRTFKVEYDLDSADPAGFVIIKRTVPEWEQDHFWKHTKYIREKRLIIEDKRHHHRHKSDIELVVRKKERKRSKSPSPLMMWVAGGRP
ncbi:hypothetical protein LEL_03403 [Akanthomyces lecanii RCEF 1005]|uniref:Uncharacterized protein n=1 Tax=Akanthomyces lecanii RCEF 1005 TaxID=1081108 RepID=A0A168J1I2_CORDF|nr:hypothetical protein LEL_03403 [Akanthomyces lecanii RCEF 1005]